MPKCRAADFASGRNLSNPQGDSGHRRKLFDTVQNIGAHRLVTEENSLLANKPKIIRQADIPRRGIAAVQTSRKGRY
jgi:hypothetical protein